MNPEDEVELSRWCVTEGVTCVSCPDCAFTFDACHTDVGTDLYSCPMCAEARADAAARYEHIGYRSRTYNTPAPLAALPVGAAAQIESLEEFEPVFIRAGSETETK